jgi:hypothetical protein
MHLYKPGFCKGYDNQIISFWYFLTYYDVKGNKNAKLEIHRSIFKNECSLTQKLGFFKSFFWGLLQISEKLNALSQWFIKEHLQGVLTVKMSHHLPLCVFSWINGEYFLETKAPIFRQHICQKIKQFQYLRFDL